MTTNLGQAEDRKRTYEGPHRQKVQFYQIHYCKHSLPPTQYAKFNSSRIKFLTLPLGYLIFLKIDSSAKIKFTTCSSGV